MKYIIYGLVDPRDMLVYYIGKSNKGLVRPAQHCSVRSLRAKNEKNVWLHELFADGQTYITVVLDTTTSPNDTSALCWWWRGMNTTQLNDLERWWIAYGRACGWPLTNMTSGGDGISGMHSITRAKIGAKNKVHMSRPEAKENLRSKAIARMAKPEVRENVRTKTKARMSNLEARAVISASVTRYMENGGSARVKSWAADPEVRVRMSRNITEFMNKPEIKVVYGARAKRNWENTDFREAVTAGVRESWANAEDRRTAQSLRAKALWADPEFRLKMQELRKTPEYIERTRLATVASNKRRAKTK